MLTHILSGPRDVYLLGLGSTWSGVQTFLVQQASALTLSSCKRRCHYCQPQADQEPINTRAESGGTKSAQLLKQNEAAKTAIAMVAAWLPELSWRTAATGSFCPELVSWSTTCCCALRYTSTISMPHLIKYSWLSSSFRVHSWSVSAHLLPWNRPE